MRVGRNVSVRRVLRVVMFVVMSDFWVRLLMKVLWVVLVMAVLILGGRPVVSFSLVVIELRVVMTVDLGSLSG